MPAIDGLQLTTMTVGSDTPGITVLTLNRAERLNAMTTGMFDELMAVAQALKPELDRRALIITGAGRGFCAGYDLDQAQELTELGIRELLRLQETAAGALAAIRALPFPVIAAVNGVAAGGGLALALSADIRLASPDASFNAAFVKIGLSCGELGTSWTLTRLVGPGRAAEICFTGRSVEAEEAERIGLVNRVAPAASLLDEALAMARLIAANSPGGVQLSKRSMQANLEIGSYAAALELENRGQALLTRGEDMPEALAAFRERREPRFGGR